MTAFRCTCVPDGQVSPHSRPEQCTANRAATAQMMANINFHPRVDFPSTTHDEHLVPYAGCPLCPRNFGLRRDSSDGEWYITKEG